MTYMTRRDGCKKATTPNEPSMNTETSEPPQWVTDHPSYKQAVDYARNDRAKACEYDWVASYSTRAIERYYDVFRSTDGKADSIIRYMGGGTGLFAITLISKADSTPWYVILSAFPAFIVAVCSIACAARIRAPTDIPALPMPRQARRYAERHGDQSEGEFIAQMNTVCVGMALVNAKRAKSLDKSTRLYVLSIILLAFPLVAGAIASCIAKGDKAQSAVVRQP